MDIKTEDPLTATPKSPVKPLGWLHERREAIRKRGNTPIDFTPIKIKGEPLSMTVIRERRGDFDDDPVS